MKSTGPVDGNVAFLPVEARGTLHTTACADTTELEQTIEYGTVITDVVLSLLPHIAIHVVGRDLLEEIDVVIGVELGHFASSRWLGALLTG
jgi:hypothetical protein